MGTASVWANYLEFSLGSFLVAAAALKFVDQASPYDFLVALGLRARLASVAAHTVVPAEAGVGLLLIGGFLGVGISAAAVLLTATFLGVSTLAYARHVDEDCGCVGFVHADAPSLVSVARAVPLLAASVLLLTLHVRLGLMWRATPEVSLASAYGLLTGFAYLLAFMIVQQVHVFMSAETRPAIATSEP